MTDHRRRRRGPLPPTPSTRRWSPRWPAASSPGRGRPTVTTTAPFTGAPLAELPLSDPGRRRGSPSTRARAAQRAWARRPLAERARPAAGAARPGAGRPGRAARPDPDRERQGPRARVRGGLRRRDRGPALRAARVVVPAAAAPRGRPAAAVPAGRAAPPQGRRRHHRARGTTRSPWPSATRCPPCSPATPSCSSRTPDRADRAARPRAAHRAPGCRRVWSRSSLGDGPVVGSALVDAVDYVCFTGSTRTGRQVAERAGRRLVGASMELGGKNAHVRRADARPRPRGRGRRPRLLLQHRPAVHRHRADAAARGHRRRLPRPLPPRVRDLRLGAGAGLLRGRRFADLRAGSSRR